MMNSFANVIASSNVILAFIVFGLPTTLVGAKSSFGIGLRISSWKRHT